MASSERSAAQLTPPTEGSRRVELSSARHRPLLNRRRIGSGVGGHFHLLPTSGREGGTREPFVLSCVSPHWSSQRALHLPPRSHPHRPTPLHCFRMHGRRAASESAGGDISSISSSLLLESSSVSSLPPALPRLLLPHATPTALCIFHPDYLLSPHSSSSMWPHSPPNHPPPPSSPLRRPLPCLTSLWPAPPSEERSPASLASGGQWTWRFHGSSPSSFHSIVRTELKVLSGTPQHRGQRPPTTSAAPPSLELPSCIERLTRCGTC